MEKNIENRIYIDSQIYIRDYNKIKNAIIKTSTTFEPNLIYSRKIQEHINFLLEKDIITCDMKNEFEIFTKYRNVLLHCSKNNGALLDIYTDLKYFLYKLNVCIEEYLEN